MGFNTRDAVSEFWASRTSKLGVALIVVLFAISAYVLASYPTNFGTQVLNKPQYWADYPKGVPPSWTQFFSDIQKNGVIDLARILRKTLRKLKYSLNDPAYNFLVHTTPIDEGHVPFYHWHIEIMPRLTRVAGFEWGTGFYINPMPPEDASIFIAEVNESAAVAGA